MDATSAAPPPFSLHLPPPFIFLRLQHHPLTPLPPLRAFQVIPLYGRGTCGSDPRRKNMGHGLADIARHVIGTRVQPSFSALHVIL